MDKSDFQKQAQPFISWLSNYLDEASSTNNGTATVPFHQWTARSHKAAPNKEDLWTCTSLYGAYSNYYWKVKNPLNNQNITSFSENESCLEALKKQLHNAIQNNDAELCRDACEKILQWGGVERYQVAKLIRSSCLSNALPRYLDAIRIFLSTPNLTTDGIFNFNYENSNYGLEVDSGTTKIYSLLVPNWIIYDGRVGAALGFLVNRWATQKKEEIPSALKFSWGYGQFRNPNTGKARVFPQFSSTVDRFEHNLYANWLCELILELNPKSQFNKAERSGRALEAALFMIGYCIRQYDEYDEEACELSNDLSFTIDDQSVIQRICERFCGESQALISQQRGNPIEATLTEAGISVDNLGEYPFLPWVVFTETVQLLKEQNRGARRGDAMKRLGSEELPFDSVEGYIAHRIYNKQKDDSVFRRISPIANILAWAGICKHERGKLSLLQQ